MENSKQAVARRRTSDGTQSTPCCPFVEKGGKGQKMAKIYQMHQDQSVITLARKMVAETLEALIATERRLRRSAEMQTRQGCHRRAGKQSKDADGCVIMAGRLIALLAEVDSLDLRPDDMPTEHYNENVISDEHLREPVRAQRSKAKNYIS